MRYEIVDSGKTMDKIGIVYFQIFYSAIRERVGSLIGPTLL